MDKEFLHWFPNEGYRPARFLNDFIGPRMDCPLIVKADDTPYRGKIDPYAHLAGYAWGTWLPNAAREAPALAQAAETASSFAGVAGTRDWASTVKFSWPSYPPRSDHPCPCITTPPEVPPVAPVPIEASAFSMLLFCIIAAPLCGWMVKRRKAHA